MQVSDVRGFSLLHHRPLIVFCRIGLCCALMLGILGGFPTLAQRRAPQSYAGHSKSGKPTLHQSGRKSPTSAVKNNTHPLDPVLAKRLADKQQRMRFDQPGEALQWDYRKRTINPNQPLPMERYIQALEKMETMPQVSTALGKRLPSRQQLRQTRLSDTERQSLGAWTELGPGNIGGRTRKLFVNPTDPSILFTGGVGGGVWRSTDGGGSWKSLTDALANLAVCALAVVPGPTLDQFVIYAGTGEGFLSLDVTRGGSGASGNGIFRSTDGGATWQHLPDTINNSNFEYVNDLVVSPTNPNRVYAATQTGIWRTINGGDSWQQVYATDVRGGAMDLALRTDQPTDVLFATIGTFAQAAILRNKDAAGTGNWETVLNETGMGRTSLAIAPSDQSTIYAMSASIESRFDFNYTNGLHAVFRSTSNGDPGSWSARVRNTDPVRLNTVLLSNTIFAFLNECRIFSGPTTFFNQGWWDNIIAVDPINPDIVFAGGIDLFRSNDGGANWGMISHWWASPEAPRYSHADHHDIVFHPQYDGVRNQTMFVTSDGGIERTDNARGPSATGDQAPCSTENGGVFWRSLNNGYSVTQFYHGTAYQSARFYFGGTQDNGTVRGGDSTGINWGRVFGGDGGYVAIDPVNLLTQYVSTPNGSFYVTNDGGRTFEIGSFGLADRRFLFITPFAMDPKDPKRFWTGGQRMWQCDNAMVFWDFGSAPLYEGDSFSSVSAIAISPQDSNIVLAGRADGFIHRTTAALSSNRETVWPAVQPREGFVSSLAFDPKNPSVVYATYSTFGGNHVWQSTDAGASWMPFDGVGSGRLPDLPVHSVLVDPGNSARVFVGTDLGVFTTLDSGRTWLIENTGFANTVVQTLCQDNGNLVAFTHGRGAWKVSLASQPDPTPAIAGFFPTSGPVGTTVSVSGSNLTGATQVRFGDVPATSFSVASANQLTAVVPSGTPGGQLRVTTPKGTAVSAGSFTVTFAPPTITSFSPPSGESGTVVTINGTQLTGTTNVQFGQTSAPFEVLSSTQLQATVPIGADSGPIAVTTANGTATSQESFTVVVKIPKIVGFTPQSGPVGTQVTINGLNLSNTGAVSFGNVAASVFQVLSDTQLSATVPAGATTGVISVITPTGGASSDRAFLVEGPDFSLAATASNPTPARGGKITATVTIARTGGLTDQITVTAPALAGFKFKPASQTTSGTSVSFTVKIKNNAPQGQQTLVFSGRDASGRTRTVELIITIR